MNFKNLIICFFCLVLITGCQTIKQKSDEVAERENERFGQFVGKQVNELKKELGVPTDDFVCLLYTSDAADDTPCVDLGGRRIIKKKKQPTTP